MGYNGCSVAHAKAAFPLKGNAALNATDIDYGNLYETTGYSDTTVSFNIAGVPHYLCTCYEDDEPG